MVVALVRSDGIYLGADSRRTGHLIRDDAFKLVQVGPQAIAALRGSAALEDDESGAVLWATRHLKNMLNGPLPSTKVAPGATDRERIDASRSTRQQVLTAVQPFVDRIERDWNEDGILARVKGATEEDPLMLGLTLAQEETDGWILLVDLEWIATVSPDKSRVTMKFSGGKPIHLGFFKKTPPFCRPSPGCTAVIPNGPEESDDPIQWIDGAFDLTTKRGECSTHIGGPVDIALTQRGSVRFLRLKPGGPAGSISLPRTE